MRADVEGCLLACGLQQVVLRGCDARREMHNLGAWVVCTQLGLCHVDMTMSACKILWRSAELLLTHSCYFVMHAPCRDMGAFGRLRWLSGALLAAQALAAFIGATALATHFRTAATSKYA